MDDEGRRCSRCFNLYPPHLVADVFRTLNTRGRLDASKRRSLCRACEQTCRDDRKRDDRWKTKASDTIRRHAKRLDVTPEHLTRVCGWDRDRLAHDAAHQYTNGCNYCGRPYEAMGHGLADITLDVIDRAKAPNYRTNTKWCCMTCNRKKGAMSPEAFEADRQMWEIWTEGQANRWSPVYDDPASLFYNQTAA